MPAPYEFSPYHNPQADQTIASLLQDQGRIQADAARASGNAWAGAIQNIGQTVAQIPQQIQQRQQQQVQQQTAEQQLAEQTRAMKARDALSSVMQTTPKLSEDGVSVWDVGAISKGMTDRGFGPEGASAAQHINAVNDAFRQARAAQLAVVKTGAQAVIAAGNDPTLANHFIDQLETNKLYPPDQIAKFRDFIKQDPKNVAKLTAFLAGPQKLTTVAAGATAINEAGQPVFSAPDRPVTVAPGASLVKPATGEAIYTAPEKKTDKQLKSVLLDGKPAEVVFDPGSGKSFDAQGTDVSARVKPIPSTAAVMLNAGSGLSGDALDQAAQKYLDTGVLPPGMGAAGIQRQSAIMNRAAQLDPKAAIARNAAVFKANEGNLVNLQKVEGSLSAFEGAAGKNIDQFLSLSSKLPESGVPWLNTPLRNLSDKLVGSEWLPAVQAARKIALREVARVTNDPKLSGQLTDAARSEVNEMADGNATIAQMLKVFPVLKQDMANVHSSLNEEIAAVKDQISGGGKSGKTVKVGPYTVTVR